MIEGSLTSVAETLGGRLAGSDARYRGVSIDTRTLADGQLFFALRGPNFDGARFLPQAVERGAAGAVVAAAEDAPLAQIIVDDPRRALGQLGRAWRESLPVTVIGVTGSNGKTTVKELLASCLSPTAATLATDGNLNNDLGVPLMLARLSAAHRYAVLEMGANHAGEIAYLVSLARPSIVLLNNAGPAHLEGFGSLDGVARAKGEILRGEPRPATAILNADDRYFELWCGYAADIEVLSFGLGENADVRVTGLVEDGEGSRFRLRLPDAEIDVRLPLAGAHNAVNAAAAAAAAHAAGLDAAQIEAGLCSVRPVGGRLEPLAGARGVQLYDDSYNANPASVAAAARYLAARPGRAFFVLGDMGELGPEAADLHASVGSEIRAAGGERLFAGGELSRHAAEAFGDGASWYASVDELIASLENELGAGVNVLVKGSRSMRMERVVEACRAGGGR